MFGRNIRIIYFLTSLALLPFVISFNLIAFGVNVALGVQFIAYAGWFLGIVSFFFFVVSWPVGTVFDSKAIRVASIVFLLTGLYLCLSGLFTLYYTGLKSAVFAYIGSEALFYSTILLAVVFLLLGYGYMSVDIYGDTALRAGALLLIIGAFIQIIAVFGLMIVGYFLGKLEVFQENQRLKEILR